MKGQDGRYYDQQEMLVMKVMDISKDRKTGKPKMIPVSIKLHPPKNWDDKRTIHRPSIDRSQKLRRITETRQRERKTPYEQEEREFIASQMRSFRESPSETIISLVKNGLRP